MKAFEKDAFISEINVSRVKHKFYILGLIISFSPIVALFILLIVFFDSQSVWPVICSCSISVLGGVFASFLISYLIEFSSARRENESVFCSINNEASSIVDSFDALFDHISEAYFNSKEKSIGEMITEFPYESFDGAEEKSMMVLILLSMILSSFDTIRNIDRKYGSTILPSDVKDSLIMIEEGLIKFRECCIHKNGDVADSASSLILNIVCVLFFVKNSKYLKKELNK